MATETGNGEAGGADVGMVIPTKGAWGKLDIAERIIKKLARIAGLAYKDGHPRGGGGLCLEIEGVKPRQKALVLLGVLVARVGEGSTDAALLEAGATWLDVMMWREDSEYARLWGAVDRLRDAAVGARTKDALWSRVLEGYDVEEVKKGAGGELEKVTTRKFDNRLGVQMLGGFGIMTKPAVRQVAGGSVKRAAGGTVMDAPAPVEAGGNNAPEPDTVLFADRKTAFAAMGGPKGPAAKPPAGKE